MKNRNILFILVSIIGGMFIIFPLLLRISCIRIAFSYFLEPLGDKGYKSSYVETFGAILGTFLAVTGTLWTQRKIDETTEKKELKESALIVYYDFKFAFNDVTAIVDSYLFSQRKITNVIEDFEKYKKIRRRYRIHMDDNWIHNVAKLSSVLYGEEIQIIYKLYGDLSRIKKVFNSPINEISENEEQSVYSIMFNTICNIEAEFKHPIRIEVTLKDDIKNIMEKLKEIGNVAN